MTSFWQPLALSVELAAVTMAVLLVVGLPLAYWLAFGSSRLRPLVHAVVSLPLVLPPTVIGFYLLMLLGPAGPFGRWLEDVVGLRLVFSFPGLVIGSVIYSLPFMVQPIETALSALPPLSRRSGLRSGQVPLADLLAGAFSQREAGRRDRLGPQFRAHHRRVRRRPDDRRGDPREHAGRFHRHLRRSRSHELRRGAPARADTPGRDFAGHACAAALSATSRRGALR